MRVEEERVADTVGQFYAHGRATGGGPPLFPPEQEEEDDDDDSDGDVNFLPVNLPDHLQVMGPPVTINSRIVRGPLAATTGNSHNN